MTSDDVLDLVGSFGWDFGQHFFIRTPRGNYVWSDPEYGGDNTLYRYNGSEQKWLKEGHVPFLRDKGFHVIRDYCGPDVKVVG